MTGHELHNLRAQAGLSFVEFGRALGYADASDKTLWRRMRRLEMLLNEAIPESVSLRALGFELEWQASRVREYQRILRMRREIRQ